MAVLVFFSILFFAIMAKAVCSGEWAVAVIMLVLAAATAVFHVEVNRTPCSLSQILTKEEERRYNGLHLVSYQAALWYLGRAGKEHKKHCWNCWVCGVG